MSLTNEEKIRRIATPHTIDVEVEHDCTVGLAYSEFATRLSVPMNIPTTKFSAINTNAHKRLKEANLFFRSPGDLSTSENVFLVQNTVDSTTQYDYYYSATNPGSRIRWPYGTFLYVQKFPDDILFYWRGNATCRGSWNNVIVPISVSTYYWGLNLTGTCTINLAMDLYELVGCALTQVLMERNGAEWLSLNQARIVIPLPDHVVSSVVFYNGPGLYDWYIPQDVKIAITFAQQSPSTLASSVRVLSPRSISIAGELYDPDYPSEPYASFGTYTDYLLIQGNPSASATHVPIESKGPDVVVFDPATYTLTNTRTLTMGYASYPTLTGTPPNEYWGNAPPATTPNVEIITELQPSLTLNPNSQYIADGYLYGGSLIRALEDIRTGDRGNVFWRPSNSTTTQEASGLFYQIPRIFGYENEVHEIKSQQTTSTAEYEITTKLKFKPEYL